MVDLSEAEAHICSGKASASQHHECSIHLQFQYGSNVEHATPKKSVMRTSLHMLVDSSTLSDERYRNLLFILEKWLSRLGSRAKIWSSRAEQHIRYSLDNCSSSLTHWTLPFRLSNSLLHATNDIPTMITSACDRVSKTGFLN